jgi:succinate dehydrogenase / fumarate reductase cytochrome b subunit
MAGTGIILFGFVFVHMIGNLQAYMGPEALNHYGAFLRELVHGWALWIFRIVLLVSVALHIWAATALTIENLKARPVGYRQRTWQDSTYASRTMVWSGPILALFVVYHILHFTTGTVHPSFIEGDVYHNFVAGFRVVPVSAFYIVAMLALGYHLYHGFWSMLQTLGLSHPRYNPLRHACSAVFSIGIVAVNISFPIAVMAGIIR